ncbi:hypothetical protein P4S72_26735 [Vibrio sp. PP-XX7]
MAKLKGTVLPCQGGVRQVGREVGRQRPINMDPIVALCLVVAAEDWHGRALSILDIASLPPLKVVPWTEQ